MYSNLCTITNLYCLHQAVIGPTHVHHDGSESTIMELFQKPVKIEKMQGCHIWRYTRADWNRACEFIDEFNWDSILTQDIELSWKQWHQLFMSIIAESIPNKGIPTRRNLPWLSKSIIKAMKKQNLFLKGQKDWNLHRCKLVSNCMLAQLRIAKRNYFQALNPKNSKKFWKAMKFLNMNKQSIPTLSLDSTVVTSVEEKANLLNTFFCSCLNRSHPPIQHQDIPISADCLAENLCSEFDVSDMLAALDITKASGPDSISARMLKSTASSIAPSLTKLFNLFLTTSTLPSSWKKSLVIAIPKKPRAV